MKISVLLAGVAAATLMVSGAQAADLLLPTTTPAPVYDASVFGFDGFYAGLSAGGLFAEDDGRAGSIGVVAGYNFTVSDPIVLGVEGQLDALYYDGEFNAYDALILGRIGVLASDQVLVYAAAGIGTLGNDDDNEGIYAVGGGVEVAVTDNMSIRGEVLGLGFLDDNVLGDNGFHAAKATVSVLWHF
ncbi:MAG TPA: outer membrane beta-barrel protein [Devosiaceae bacterium]|jgi:outer membrane immunogenic protein